MRADRRTPNVAAVATAVAIFLVLVTAGAAPAYAVHTWGFADGFEAGQGAWTQEGVSGFAGVDQTPGLAHSGIRYGYLDAEQGGWGALGINLNVGIATNVSGVCTATVFIDPEFTRKLNLEVINPNNWTYIAVKTVTLGGSGVFYQAAGLTWTVFQTNVHFRISVLGDQPGFSGAHIDDVSIVCSSR